MTNAIKIIIGILLVSLVIQRSDLSALQNTLNSADLGLYFSVILIYLCSQLLGTLKWHKLVPQFKFFELLRSNLVAAYYSVFVPGQLATEGIKTYRLASKKKQIEEVLASVFIDKVIGFLCLLLLAIYGLYFSEHAEKLKAFCIPVILTSLFAVLVLSQFKLVLKLIHKFFALTFLSKIREIKFIAQSIKSLEQIDIYYQKITANKQNILLAVLIGIVFQILNTLGNFLIAKSLGIEISFIDWTWIMAALTISLLIPITVGGLGLREMSLAGLFHLISIPLEQALVFSLAVYGQLLINSFIGYLIDLRFGIHDKLSKEA